MTIQIQHRCEHYKRNENMNLTCTFKGIERMCRIYYGEACREYKEKDNDECRMDIKND